MVAYKVRLTPRGDVDDIQLVRSSGVAAYDEAMLRTITDAAPLPVWDDPSLYEKVHTLTLEFRSRSQ